MVTDGRSDQGKPMCSIGLIDLQCCFLLLLIHLPFVFISCVNNNRCMDAYL